MIFLQYMSDVFNNIDDAVMLIELVDSRYRLVMANRSFFDISTYSKSDEGKYVDEIISEEQYFRLKKQYEKVVNKKIPVSYSSQVGKGSSYKSYSSRLVPVLDSFERCTHIVIVSKDITEIEKLKSKVKELKSKK